MIRYRTWKVRVYTTIYSLNINLDHLANKLIQNNTPSYRYMRQSPKPVLASPVFQSDWALDKSRDSLVESDPCYGPLGSSVPMHVRWRPLNATGKKGFIVVTGPSYLGVEGKAKYYFYEITELPMPGKKNGKHLYASWTLGNDYPIIEPINSKPRRKT